LLLVFGFLQKQIEEEEEEEEMIGGGGLISRL
jgi:hypothetical protein